MLHLYRLPPTICGRLLDTATFFAHSTHDAIERKKEECERNGNPRVALRITGFTMQVLCGRKWMEAAKVSVGHGGMDARDGC